jgi:hypothetical protein
MGIRLSNLWLGFGVFWVEFFDLDFICGVSVGVGSRWFWSGKGNIGRVHFTQSFVQCIFMGSENRETMAFHLIKLNIQVEDS